VLCWSASVEHGWLVRSILCGNCCVDLVCTVHICLLAVVINIALRFIDTKIHKDLRRKIFKDMQYIFPVNIVYG
jgi:hypothetical protein